MRKNESKNEEKDEKGKRGRKKGCVLERGGGGGVFVF